MLYCGQALATGRVRACCVLLWRGAVDEASFARQREALQFVTQAYAGEASVLCIIEATSEPPSQEMRQRASRLLEELGASIRCIAYVIEGSGFRAAIIRGVLSSIEMLKRDKVFPSRYFGSVPEAAAWLASADDQRVEIAEAATHLRNRLDLVGLDR